MTDDVQKLLAYLYSESERGGWCMDGLLGWRFEEELQAVGGYNADDAIWALKHNRALMVKRVRRAGRRYPNRVYRISPVGAKMLSAECDLRPIMRRARKSPDAGTAEFVTAEEWSVLEALIRRSDTRLGPLRFGEGGWMTGWDLRISAGCTMSLLRLAPLADGGWIEKRATGEDGGADQSAYRATPRALRLTAWTAPVPGHGPIWVALARGEDDRDA